MYALWFMWAGACTFEVPPDVKIDPAPTAPTEGDSGLTEDTGGDGDANSPGIEIPRPSEDLAIAGTWHRTRTASISFTATQSVSTLPAETRAIATYNNDQQWLIYTDGLFLSDEGSRVDWYIDDSGHLRTCEHPEIASVGALMAAESPAQGAGGCFGENWVTARSDLAIAGTHSIYEWLYSFDPFVVTDVEVGTDYPILAHWAGEPWAITQPFSDSDPDGTWLVEWREDGTGHWMCPVNADGATDWTALRSKVDDSDWDVGCDDGGWWELRQPFAARGRHEVLGSAIPNNLYEWFSSTTTRGAGFTIMWEVQSIAADGKTMVLNTTSEDVSRDERNIKLQVAADAAGQWSICLLAAEPDLATAEAAPPVAPLVDGACTSTALGTTPGWKPLVPVGG